MTGTTGIDVDGFAIAPNGDLYFSFAEDETTTNASADRAEWRRRGARRAVRVPVRPGRSGGDDLPDARRGGRRRSTTRSARRRRRSSTSATSRSIRTNPGDLLLTSLSTAAAFRGKVITTAGGGTPFVLGGQQIGPDGARAAPRRRRSTRSRSCRAPRTPVLRAIPEVISSATPIVARVESSGWTPGAAIQFVVTDAVHAALDVHRLSRPRRATRRARSTRRIRCSSRRRSSIPALAGDGRTRPGVATFSFDTAGAAARDQRRRADHRSGERDDVDARAAWRSFRDTESRGRRHCAVAPLAPERPERL